MGTCRKLPNGEFVFKCRGQDYEITHEMCLSRQRRGYYDGCTKCKCREGGRKDPYGRFTDDDGNPIKLKRGPKPKTDIKKKDRNRVKAPANGGGKKKSDKGSGVGGKKRKKIRENLFEEN